MTDSVAEIRDRVTSNEIEVLKQSLAFANVCLADEKDRGKTAETRAAAMLAVLGVIAGLVVPEAQALGAIEDSASWCLLIGYIAPLLFLLRGVTFAWRVLGVSQRFRNKPERLYAFQECSRQDALREEIAAVIWEYRQIVGPTNTKLHCLQRCQRNGVAAIVFLAFFAVATIASGQTWFVVQPYVAIGLGLVVAVAFAGERFLSERGMWRRERRRV